MIARVSERGQVVIPKPLRDKLGIRPGQRLDFQEERGRLVVAKTPDEADPVDSVYGILRPVRTDKLIERLRGRPDTV